MACPMPAYLALLCLFLTVNERLHTLIVEAIRLDEVDNVEAVSLTFASIRHSEVEPLAELLWSAMVKFKI